MTFDSFNITDTMKEKGISKMGIQGDNFLIVIYNDISIKVDYNKEDWFEMTQRFESAAAAYIADQLFIQKIVSELTLNWYAWQKAAEPEDRPISVLEAKRKHAGAWIILGKIVTVSDMYVIEVAANPPDKPETEYKDAKSIQLEDIEKLDDNERLDVILYNDDIINVIPGEIVQITGGIELHDVVKAKQSQTKIKRVVVNATSIKYVHRKELVITPRDIISFEKFASYPNLTKRLSAMFAPNVIGHDFVKLGLLRSIVGGYDHGQRGGGRVNTFMVGEPGTAKSTLG